MPNNFTFAHTQENPFNRKNSAYTQDEIRIIKPTHKFMGQITESTTNKASSTTIRIIDDAVMISSVDDKTRQLAKEYFSSLTHSASQEKQCRNEDFKSGVAKTIFGLSLSATATYCLAALILPVSLPGAAIACGIATTVLGIRQVTKSKTAIHHIQENIDLLNQRKNEWNDPIEAIIYQRNQAGIKGLQYVLDNDLKNKSIHPEEVKTLWLKDFQELLTKHQTASQIFKENILGKKTLEYVFEGSPLPDLEIGCQKLSSSFLNMLSMRYQQAHAAYSELCTQINNQLYDLQAQQSLQQSQISTLRTKWTTPALRMYNIGIEEAEHLYNSSLAASVRERDLAIEECRRAFHYVVKDPLDSEEIDYKAHLDGLCRESIKHIEREYEPIRCAIQHAYDRDRRMCTLLFNQSKLVVDSFFDTKIRQLEAEVTLAKQQIETQRFNGLQHFENILNRLLHSSSEISLQQQSICTPPLIKNLRLSNQALEPCWSDVYGQIPSFHSSFNNDISETSWNLFWGNNGLGRYARQPINSWERIDADRQSFPFKQQWFNLHSVSQPRPRMFCRPVIVPPPAFQSCPPPVCHPVRPEPTRPCNPDRPTRPICPTPERVTPEVRDSRTHVPVGTGGVRQPQCPAPMPEPVRPPSRPEPRPEPVRPASYRPAPMPEPVRPAPSRPEPRPEPVRPVPSRPAPMPEPVRPAPSRPEPRPEPVRPVPSRPAPMPEPVRPAPSRPAEAPSRAFAPTDRRRDQGQEHVVVGSDRNRGDQARPAQRTELVGDRVRAGTVRR